MSKIAKKLINHALRKKRIRATISGTADRPRLSVFISNYHVSAQLIDDSRQHTIASSTTAKPKGATGTLAEKAAWVGVDIAKQATKAGVTKVTLDRNGRQYQGRLKALAEAARKEGLEF